MSGCFITMKQKKLLYARACALPAIAAALALSSTPLMAQVAQPVTATPPPAITTEPAPTPEATPTTTETTTTTTEEPAPTDAAPVAKKTTTTVKRTTRTAATKPATTTTRTTTTRTVARAAPLAPAAPAAPATATQPAPSQSAVTPVVDVNAKPATAPAAKPAKADETLPILGGIALVLLALGAVMALMARRRRGRDEETWVYDEPVAEAEPVAAAEPEPVIHEEQPAIVAPSAFAWGEQNNGQPRADQTVGDDDRMPGETWIQRAYRGPTPNNPSVSLKARLKRAAFFDKRERDVAAGKAEPVEMGAGLPESMVDEERETA